MWNKRVGSTQLPMSLFFSTVHFYYIYSPRPASLVCLGAWLGSVSGECLQFPANAKGGCYIRV